MADATPNADQQPPQEPAREPAPTPADMPQKQEKAGTDWQAEARKWEQRAKANNASAKEAETLREKLQAFEDRDKSDLEKLTEKLAAAEKSAQTASREALRYRIAAEKSVDPELLAGDDEDGMRAHAERLLAWRGEAKPTAPKSDPSQGSRGPVDIDAQIRDAEAKGDIREAIALKNRKLLGATQQTT